MKTPCRKSNQVKIEAADVGELPEALPLSEYLDPEVVSRRNRERDIMEHADLEELAIQIRQRGEEADRHRTDALASAVLAMLNAWTCGSMLNIAKSKLNHGEFIPWLTRELENTSFEIRTAQRYMQIAKRFSCVEDLVAWKPSLRQTYIACGMLPEPAESPEKTAEKDSETTAKAVLLKSVASVQDILLRFSNSGNFKIDDETKKELVAAKAEIDQLFEDLIG